MSDLVKDIVDVCLKEDLQRVLQKTTELKEARLSGNDLQSRISSIAKMNKLADPNKIYAGKTLNIDGSKYTIKRGDNLTKIARSFSGTSKAPAQTPKPVAAKPEAAPKSSNQYDKTIPGANERLPAGPNTRFQRSAPAPQAAPTKTSYDMMYDRINSKFKRDMQAPASAERLTDNQYEYERNLGAANKSAPQATPQAAPKVAKPVAAPAPAAPKVAKPVAASSQTNYRDYSYPRFGTLAKMDAPMPPPGSPVNAPAVSAVRDFGANPPSSLSQTSKTSNASAPEPKPEPTKTSGIPSAADQMKAIEATPKPDSYVPKAARIGREPAPINESFVNVGSNKYRIV